MATLDDDKGFQETEALIGKMEKRIESMYSDTEKEMRKKLKTFMREYEAENKQKKRDLKSGKITQEQYEGWLKSKSQRSKWLTEMVNTLTEDHVTADVKAMSMVRGFMPEAYAINRNYAAFEVEKGSMLDTSYTLYDAHTVENLIKNRPNLLPQPKTDIPKDKRWNRQKITAEVTKGILEGESVPDIAKRLRNVTDMDKRAALRNARTAATGAQNAGRVDGYKYAQSLGIDLKQEWLATLDGRTRHSHRALDGERIEVGKVFSNGCRYPGDPSGPAAEVYNCRCTLVAAIEGIDQSNAPRNSRLGDMSYEEWKYGHKVEKEEATEEVSSKHVIAEGNDISGSWVRRPDKFDFEIEDVVNAQGFDGLPSIVSDEEFEKAVKDANGGKGFIAQRTYSAPDQETLDAYREQLYSGKWYIDCSTGGSQYGRGMYCAADYEGKLTDGIKQEMEHYIKVNAEKGASVSYIETMTLDKTAKIINYENVGKEFRASMRENLDSVAKQNGLPKTWVKKMQDTYDKADELDKMKKKGYTIQDSSYKKLLNSVKKGEDSAASIAEKSGMRFSDAARLSDAYWNDVRNDFGSMAAKMGYDAINAEGHGDSGSYTVVLNRTKLIIRRP